MNPLERRTRVEKERSKKGGQSKKGRTGRPPNKPRVVPPKNVSLAPKLEASRSRQLRGTDTVYSPTSKDYKPASDSIIPLTPDTPASSQRVAMQHIPPTAMPMLRARRRRGIGPINLNALHPGESTEDVEFVAGNGDRVTLQNALVSPLYPRCFMTPKTAEVLGFIPCGLVDADIQAFPTPRGVFEITRTVALCFRLPLLPSPPLVVEIPILSDDEPDPGVPIILGRSFIEYMDSLSFPNPQYVELDVPFAPPNGGLNVWFEDYNGAVANMPMANGVVDFLPRHDVAPVANMPIADGMVDFPENSGDAMANMPAADVMAWQGWIGYEEYDPWRA